MHTPLHKHTACLVIETFLHANMTPANHCDTCGLVSTNKRSTTLLDSETKSTLNNLARIWSDTGPSLGDDRTGLSISDNDTHLFANGGDHHAVLFSRPKEKESPKLLDYEL